MGEKLDKEIETRMHQCGGRPRLCTRELESVACTDNYLIPQTATGMWNATPFSPPERDGQTDRQTETDTQTRRHRHRRDIDRDRDRDRDRQRHKERYTERETDRQRTRKILILKDSNIRSVGTCLTAKTEGEKEREEEREKRESEEGREGEGERERKRD